MDTMDTWQAAPAVLQTHCRPTDRRSLHTKTTPNQPGILKEPSDHSRCQRPCVCQWTPHLGGNPPTLPADKKPSGPELRDAVVKEGDAVKSSCGITSFVKLSGLKEPFVAREKPAKWALGAIDGVVAGTVCWVETILFY